MADAKTRSASSNGRHTILLVHNSADLYGASRSLLRLAASLPEGGWYPYVVLPEEGPLAERLRAMSIPVAIHPDLRVITRKIYSSPASLARFLIGAPRSILRLRSLILRTQARIVHTNTGVIVSPAIAAAMARVPHIWHIRDWFQEFHHIWPIYDWYVRRLSARVICVSRAVAGQFSKSDKVIVINNGLPIGEFDVDQLALRSQFRSSTEIPGDELVIGTVGRIKFVRKGQEQLVEAARLLRSRGVRARFLVVGTVAPGNEDHEKRLRALIRSYDLESSFILTGDMADPRPAYAAMDVFVLPSGQPEPFGGVVLEAMAFGLPVIATAIGGSVDQVADGESGFLVPPGDPAALADRLTLLISNAELRSMMGRRGRLRFESKFTLERMLDAIVSVYRELAPARTV
jgi:glycosyltransferase involved in cell wall biosynthesis